MAIECVHVDAMPRASVREGLLELPAAAQLLDLSALEGKVSWASVRIGWNARGLGIAVRADGVGDAHYTVERPDGFATAQFWIDTRDTRNVSRATRFCHRFVANLKVISKQNVEAEVSQKPIARAIADPPMCRSSDLLSRVEVERGTWTLELFIPAKALSGFDPETTRRLGFAYQISDHVREDQFLGVGREFPVGENPSLWSVLELKG
jgi:hypothetical protein